MKRQPKAPARCLLPGSGSVSSSAGGPLFWSIGSRGMREAILIWPLSFAMAVRPVIFLPSGLDDTDAVATAAILAHERTHHRQQRALGLLRFGVCYYVNPRFRWRVERAGYGREFAIYLRAGRRPNAAAYARLLSGHFYAWMVRYPVALAWCEKTIANLYAAGRR